MSNRNMHQVELSDEDQQEILESMGELKEAKEALEAAKLNYKAAQLHLQTVLLDYGQVIVADHAVVAYKSHDARVAETPIGRAIQNIREMDDAPEKTTFTAGGRSVTLGGHK